jgi:hypothetical protein
MAALLTVLYIPMIERVMVPAFVCIIGGVDMEILVIAIGVFAGLLLFKARWVVLVAIGALIYLWPARSEEIDEKYWPIMAVAQVFHGAFFNVGGLSPHITASSPIAAKIIDASDKNAIEYAVVASPDSPCSFNLKRGSEKIAEINFDKLTDQISSSYFQGQMIYVFIEARHGAICEKVGDKKVFLPGSYQDRVNEPDANGNFDVGCTKGEIHFVMHEARLAELQRALRYIFENVCAPAKTGPLGTQR